MKIILLQNVPKVGRKYEVKNVSDGHALNLLIPRGLAEAATPNAVKRLESMRAKDEIGRKVRDELTAKNLHDLEGKTITITESANDKGHLFAGIKAEELAAFIKDQTSFDIAPEHIVLEKPLKEVGEHKIAIAIGDTKGTVNILVNAK